MNNNPLKLDLVYMVQEQYYRDKRIKQQKNNIINSIICLVIFLCAIYLSFLLYNIYNYDIPALTSCDDISYSNLDLVPVKTNVINPNYIKDVDYVVRCVTAEAGNQDDFGKRLVIDVILNRCDKYNMTTTDIINAPGQFEVVQNNMINIIEPDLHIYDLFIEEVMSRTDEDIIYFREGYFHNFGIPVISHQDHYFSKCE